MEEKLQDIEFIVRAFYKDAITDVFIGYHFRKILSDPAQMNNIKADLGNFEDHIPKVVDFWATQLIPDFKSQLSRPNVLKIHDYLNIRKGELGRWLVMFKEVLERQSTKIDHELRSNWKIKLIQFEDAFNKRFFS